MKMKKKLVTLLFDFVFKEIFGSQNNIDILTGFLQSVLDIPEEEYSHLTLVNTDLNRRSKTEKTGIVDVLVHTKSGMVIQVELQVKPADSLRKRILYYLAKLLVKQIKRGMKYKQIERVVGILITGHILVPEEEGYYNVYGFRNRKSGKLFSDAVELHTIELPKVPAEDDGSKLWKWAKLFRASNEEEFNMVAEKDPLIKKTVVTIMELSEDERADMEADHEMMWEWDLQYTVDNAEKRGIEKGREEGVAKGAEEVLSLIEQGYTAQEAREIFKQKNFNS
ncbi:hypothetical protein FACS1894190_13900 [Spirochaetia bacterium]|nr:hypothetical protein FACS1894190_13900 [Spirochaetia bacterium]